MTVDHIPDSLDEATKSYSGQAEEVIQRLNQTAEAQLWLVGLTDSIHAKVTKLQQTGACVAKDPCADAYHFIMGTLAVRASAMEFEQGENLFSRDAREFVLTLRKKLFDAMYYCGMFELRGDIWGFRRDNSSGLVTAFAVRD